MLELFLAASLTIPAPGPIEPAPIVIEQTQAAPEPMGPNDAFGFDYQDAEFVNAQVTRFEVQYDAGAWTSLGIPAVHQSSNGVTTYRVIPTSTSGTHNVSFRACNAVGCSTATPPFAFTLVTDAPATAPSNVRKIPRG